jgi:hypothetical protein
MLHGSWYLPHQLDISSATGEWKLRRFELFSDPAEPNVLLVMTDHPPSTLRNIKTKTYAGNLNPHRMPENERGGWVALKELYLT